MHHVQRRRCDQELGGPDELEHPGRNGLAIHNLALIPESWRGDPAFARSAAVTIREAAPKPPFSDGVLALAESLPDDDALDVLLPALDSWRPVRAGAALLERFGDRPEVRAVFDKRLHGPLESAAPLAPLALEALGATEGFRVLVGLLRSSTDEADGEARVLVAMSVADAWAQFSTTQEDPNSAAILREYDPNELATRCTAVGTGHLTWHVDAIIAAWPAHEAVVAFALRALQHPRHLSSGIHDPAPPAIVRAYGARSDATATMMMDAVLDQLAYLPPQLREVLVDALTRSDLTPGTLRDVLGYWVEDPDMWVQRAALTGLIRRVERYRISPNAEHAQTEEVTDWLRAQVQAELCGYGPALEDRRQNGWVGMLLLGELGLHDGLLETIGEPTRPGVHLRHLLGGVDRELVDLLNANWDEVSAHFAKGLFTLLSAVNARNVREDARASVLGQLSTSSSPHPSVNELIRAEADTNPPFRSSAEYLLWSHRRARRDLDLFIACLTSATTATSSRSETNEVYSLLVDPGSWEIPADTLRDALTQQPGFDFDPALRALFCELFPTDERSRKMFAELEARFRDDNPRERREWIDSLAVAVRSSPPRALPVIVERAHHQIMLRDTADLFPLLTGPLLRRLRQDPDAVTALRAAIQDPASAVSSTPIWAQTPAGGQTRDPTFDTQRSYLMATVLDHVGVLDERTATIVREMLTVTNPDVVVKDPFTGAERPSRVAAVALTRHPPTQG